MKYKFWCDKGCGKKVMKTFKMYYPYAYEYQCTKCGMYYVRKKIINCIDEFVPISLATREKIIERKSLVWLEL